MSLTRLLFVNFQLAENSQQFVGFDQILGDDFLLIQ